MDRASAENLAGGSRSKVQRYLILLREWPLRWLGEDRNKADRANAGFLQAPW